MISEVPISERLYYQATTFINSVLAETYSTNKISISVPVTTVNLSSENAVGTGMTGGVDSLYTISTHGQNDTSKGYLLTHLVLLNVGSHDIGTVKPDELFEKRIKLAKDFSIEYGYEFVLIDTNIHDFLPYNYTSYFGIVNCATILSMQKLFRVYYSSSGHRIADFALDPYDVAHFELFNMSMLSTDSTIFYSVGGEITRYEKVKQLQNYTPSYHYLNVCNSFSYNCSKRTCVKCLRTMMELGACNSLEKYSSVFDLELYENNKMDYLAEMYARLILRNDIFAKEIWDDVKRKYNIPLSNKIRALSRFIVNRLKIYDLKQIKALMKKR